MRLAVVKASILPLRVSQRRARTAIALISAALLIAGCQLGSSSAAGGTQGTLTVGVVQGIGNAPLYIGLRAGAVPATRPECHGQELRYGYRRVLGADQRSHRCRGRRLCRLPVQAGHLRHVVAAHRGRLRRGAERDGSAHPAGFRDHDATDLQDKKIATPEPDAIPANGSGSISGVPYSMAMLATESVLESNGVSPSAVTWKPTPMQDMLSELSSGKR